MITVIDYGMGNLRSVSKAIERLGAEVCVSSSSRDIQKTDKLILPGVGAFKDAMLELQKRELIDPIMAHIHANKPFLGICLGLQLLFEDSEENPGVKGLGVIPGHVRRFQSTDVKIPHMGWNQVSLDENHKLLQGVANNSYFYFVHSYYAFLENEKLIAGTCTYGNDRVTAMVSQGNVFATQFHPEKSQEMGLQILQNFTEWTL